MRIARGEGRAILDTVLAARSAGEPCIVPPAHLGGAAFAAGASDIGAGEVRGPRLVAYSSGSTGLARGIVRTHASWTDSHDAVSGLIDITSRDVVWLPGSLTSTLFLYGAVHAVESGARVRIGVGDHSDITVAHTVPLQARALLSDPPVGLRTIVVAGDRVPDEFHDRAATLGIALVDYYGAAELSFVAYRTDTGAYRAFPGVQIRESGGEIWVRSAYVCERYVDQSVPGPLRRDEDWCTVGDRGRVTPAGLVVEGRGDEVVNVAGHTVLVADVEEHLFRSLRTDVVVLGVDQASVGQVLVAVTTLPISAEARRTAAADLPGAARPRRWVALPEIPLTAGGKVDRVALRRAVAGHD
jgi:long-chain acyl-CoA synthetase